MNHPIKQNLQTIGKRGYETIGARKRFFSMKEKDIKQFQKQVYVHSKASKRRFPWRAPILNIRKDGSINPYKVMVSEIMLQQTQTTRVIDKFKSFTKRFPTVQKLAGVGLDDVLFEWQGLGYNRRGKALHDAAKAIVARFGGKVPRGKEELVSLPGIGPYTAGAIRAFAFNEPEAFIETNIRTVYLHHFFPIRDQVSDREILDIIEVTLDEKQPRLWYEALMDYGADLKQQGLRINNKSRHYTKQSKFEGSDRQIRGAIVRELTNKKIATTASLNKSIGKDRGRIKLQLQKLQKDGMIRLEKGQWRI